MNRQVNHQVNRLASDIALAERYMEIAIHGTL